MFSTRQAVRFRIPVLFALGLLASFAPAGAQPVDLGLVFGDVRFVGVAGDVAGYLDGHPVGEGAATAVGCFPSGGPPIAVANTAYQVENETPSPAVRRAASFSLQPQVAATGSDFLFEVRFLRFTDGASYRFGTRLAGFTGEHRCNDVEPQGADPDGLRCDLEECAALARVRVRLVGEADDLEALQDLGGCTVQAAEDPGTTVQAFSPPAVQPVAVYRSTGVELPLLVRGSGTLRYSAACAFPVAAGEEGFPLDPDSGLAVFASDVSVSAAGSCGGTGPTVEVEVPVERIAGDVRGMFDFSGLDETVARVAILSTGFAGAPPLFAAAQTPTRGDDASYWRFENVPEGAFTVVASAILDGGDALSQFAATRPPNAATIVAAGEVTDLDATFVGRPVAVEGRVVLMDLGAETELAQIRTDPFGDPRAGDSNNSTTSRAEAAGLVNVPPGGASGVDGRALGRLRGSFDADEGEGEFEYRSWIVGSSPDGAATDGSATLPTGWELSQYALRLGQSPGNSQRVAVLPRLFFPMETPVGGGGEPFAVPERSVCFGQAEVELLIAGAEGSIFGPSLEMSGNASVTAATTIIPEASSYAARVFAQGTPRSQAAATTRASTLVTLPEGIQYPLIPKTSFVPAGSTTPQSLTLDTLLMPAEGTIGCGDVQGVCLFVRAAEEAFDALSVRIEPDFPYCQRTIDTIEFDVHVDSSGGEVDFVSFRVDGGAEQFLCLGCGVDPGPLPVEIDDLGALGAGGHAVEVRAHSVNGCDGFARHSFEISDEPLTISCEADPAPLLLAPGEDSIPGTDPRVEQVLQATTGGGCGLPIDVTDDRPAEFPPGVTEVNLSLPDGQSCLVRVMVGGSRQQLAYLDGTDVVVRRLEDDGEQFRLTSLAGPRRLAYDEQGARLAIVGTTGVTVVAADDGGSAQIFPGSFKSVAFRRTDNRHLAFVRAEPGLQPHGDYRVVVALTDQGDVFESEPLNFIPGWSISPPEIAWSADGARILAASNASRFGATESRLLFWEFTLAEDGLEMTRGDWSRPAQNLLAVAYLSPQARGLFTSRGSHSFGDNLVLNQGFQRALQLVGLPQPFEPALAFVASGSGAVGVVTEGLVAEGPNHAGKPPAVALSMDLRKVAVADDAGGRVVVYRLDFQSQPTPTLTFVEAHSFSSQPGPGLAFRPTVP